MSTGDLCQPSGPVLFGIVTLVASTGYWWVSMRFLLGGRIPWRPLFPSALATGLCWLGMVAVFSATFSGMIISSYDRYGPIGDVFDLLSYILAIGVVIILGAAAGIVWHERGLSFRAALRKSRQARLAKGSLTGRTAWRWDLPGPVCSQRSWRAGPGCAVG